MCRNVCVIQQDVLQKTQEVDIMAGHRRTTMEIEEVTPTPNRPGGNNCNYFRGIDYANAAPRCALEQGSFVSAFANQGERLWVITQEHYFIHFSLPLLLLNIISGCNLYYKKNPRKYLRRQDDILSFDYYSINTKP